MTVDTATPPPHLLVVDDDRRLRSLLQRYLGSNGFVVTAAKDAREARDALALITFDLIILDVMMPGESGMELARALVPELPTPIMMLTARGDANDRIEGLEIGVADYLAKPFEPRELVLRIHNILTMRRMQVQRETTVHFGDYQFDTRSKHLTQAGEHVHLTDSERDLLSVLAASPGNVVSRDTLAASVAPTGEEGNSRSADVMITRLRKKIEPEPSRPIYIQTVRGEGYVLRG